MTGSIKIKIVVAEIIATSWIMEMENVLKVMSAREPELGSVEIYG